MVKQFQGESLRDVLPAEMEEICFHGVFITRIVGTEQSIRETTDVMRRDLYPPEFWDMNTLNDAKYIGKWVKPNGNGKAMAYELYELIVVRKKYAGGQSGS